MWKKIKHNLPMKILSVFIAILFWFIVYINDNPIESKKIIIDLKPINLEYLDENKLKLLNEYEDVLEVNIRGRRSEVDLVEPEDFEAYIDFSNVESKYTNLLEVSGFKYNGDRNITYEIVGSKKINIKVEKIITNQIPIQVEIVGDVFEGFTILGEPIVRPSRFVVTDIESIVNEISSVVVKLDISKMKGTETETIFCNVYDKSGKEMSKFKDKKSVDVTLKMGKTVPVDIKLEGDIRDDNLITSVAFDPITVLVSGSESDLKNISKVSTLPVDIEDVDKTFATTIGLQALPIGIGYVGVTEVDVVISVEELAQKTLSFTPADIIIRYGLDNKRYTIRDKTLELTLKGKKSVLDSINNKNVKPYLDVSKTRDGNLSLPLRFENIKDVEAITFPTANIEIRSVKEFILNTENIQITNKNIAKYNYKILSDYAKLKVVGMEDLVNSIDVDALKMTVDAVGLEAATHKLPVILKIPDGLEIAIAPVVMLEISDK